MIDKTHMVVEFSEAEGKFGHLISEVVVRRVVHSFPTRRTFSIGSQ